jgi:hypothetical protein
MYHPAFVWRTEATTCHGKATVNIAAAREASQSTSQQAADADQLCIHTTVLVYNQNTHGMHARQQLSVQHLTANTQMTKTTHTKKHNQAAA